MQFKYIKKITLSGLLSALLVLTACSDQESAEHVNLQGRVEFSVSTHEDWQGVSAWSKASYTDGCTARYALRATDEAGGEYQVMATTLDGIHSRVAKQAAAGEAPLTRGVPVTTENFADQNQAFGFMSYAYTPVTMAKTMSVSAAPTAMQVVKQEDGHYYSSQNAVWFDTSASYVKLYAVAPYSAEGMSVDVGSASSVPTISYEVPQQVEQQKDLLTVTKTIANENFGERVTLTFNHVLTAVRFKVGDTPLRNGRIVKIVLKNVYTSGVYSLGETDEDRGSWSQMEDKGDFTQEVDFVTNGRTNEDITPESMQLMMIPQKLGDDAKVYVTFEVTDSKTGEVSKRTISLALGGHTWGIGQTVTYAISSHLVDFDYDITAESPAVFSYEGGVADFTVKSYRYNYQDDSETAPVQWAVDAFSLDGGKTWSEERPEWIKGITPGGEGGAGEQGNARVAVAPAPAIVDDVDGAAHVATLKAAAEKQDIDLSYYNADGERLSRPCTANCYVVHAAGTYKFPLVYGNAIKNGWRNSAAYNDAVNDGVTAFVDYKGNKMASPYVSASGTPADAVVVWQDAPGLLTDVALSNNYITFKVSRETICPGNAVVAVRDAAGNIMWSWHVWVTDHMPVSERVGKSGFDFMPVVLGWADKSKRVFEGRQALVRMKQANGKTATIAVVQRGSEEIFDPGSPYYQWGRKDPLPPAAGNKTDHSSIYGIDKPLYDNAYDFTFESTAVSAATAIAHPYTMYSEAATRGWDANHTINLWCSDYQNNENTSSKSVTKTIYDPCPYGFCIPPTEAFAEMTVANSVVENNGRTFTMDSGKKLFLPFVGFRDETIEGRVYEFNEACNFWMAWSYNDDNNKLARDFFVSNETRGVAYGCYFYRARARSIIPVAE